MDASSCTVERSRRTLLRVQPAWSATEVSLDAYDLPERFDGPPDIVVVSGIHGNEVNGPATCVALVDYLLRHPDRIRPGAKVRVIPLTNGLAMDISRRLWPVRDVDLHDQFLWAANALHNNMEVATSPHNVAFEVLRCVLGAKYCIDIHSSNPYMHEAAQVRYYLPDDCACADDYSALAADFRLPFVWAKGLGETSAFDREGPGDPRRTLCGLLSHEMGLKEWRTFSFILMAGAAQRVSGRYSRQLLSALDRFMVRRELLLARDDHPDAGHDSPVLGVAAPVPEWQEASVRVTPASIRYSFCSHAGIFMPTATSGDPVQAGQVIGRTVDLGSFRVEQHTATDDGWLLSVRVNPPVYQGAMVARLVAQPR